MENTLVSFEESWTKICEECASSANKGCGSSYHMYCENFRSLIDSKLRQVPSECRDLAVQIADGFGYSDSDMTEDCCSHGLDPDCCPCGCGDL